MRPYSLALVFLSMALVTLGADSAFQSLPRLSPVLKEPTAIKPAALPEKPIILPVLKARPPPSLPDQGPFAVADFDRLVVDRLITVAKKVKKLEIWSLDPRQVATDERQKESGVLYFHSFAVIGRAEITDREEARKLILSAALSVAKSPEDVADCFSPRIGMRIHGEKGAIDLLLCYACLQGVLYEDEKEFMFSTSNDAESVFDEAFHTLGLRKAD